GILDGDVLATLQQPVTSDDNPDTANQAPDQNAQDDANAPQDENMKSFSDYRRSLRALTRGYWSGELAAFDFVDGMVSAIQRHFEQAWEQGETLNGVSPDERSSQMQERLQLAMNTEISYVTGFANAIADNSK